ncbi:hypothetical protein FQA47_022816 [Oryzias melastigma]|uniref:Uncharacterized protein n=1 Tax=Oryzias melastigma TaxID=30732 RepID=A0A834CBM0_ORYME|nr:hypothetical protein FQA47_022816 [Oryzias melastigma]
MTERLAESLTTTEAHAVALMKTVLSAEAWMMTVARGVALMTTAARGAVLMMTAARGVALMTTVAQGVALMMIAALGVVLMTTAARGGPLMTTVARGVALMTTEVPVEGWMSLALPGVGLMMTGAPEEEEMRKEAVGGAWMMDHAEVAMTPNPGNPLADQAAGVSGRRPERRAGDRHAGGLMMKEMRKMEMTEQVIASKNAAPTERRTPGGEEEPKREEAAGEIPARRKMTVTIAVIVVIETGGMTVRTDLHPETLKKVARGAVEGRRSGRNGTGNDPVKGSVKLMGSEGLGVLTKKTPAVLRTRPMMMVGPPFAAEHHLLHLSAAG